jgi:hypothetical protein
VGRRVLAANSHAKLNPLFLTVGSDEEAIYHTGETQIVISEGLVKKCPSDADLAAVLSFELAAMMAAKEQTRQDSEVRRREAPLAPTVGLGMEPDMTRAAELADWDRRNPRTPTAPAGRVQNCEQRARDYYLKAGFSQEEFEKALPLVRFAQTNGQKMKRI